MCGEATCDLDGWPLRRARSLLTMPWRFPWPSRIPGLPVRCTRWWRSCGSSRIGASRTWSSSEPGRDFDEQRKTFPGCGLRSPGSLALSLLSRKSLACFTSCFTENRLVTESVTRGEPRLARSAQIEAGRPKWIYPGGPVKVCARAARLPRRASDRGRSRAPRAANGRLMLRLNVMLPGLRPHPLGFVGWRE